MKINGQEFRLKIDSVRTNNGNNSDEMNKLWIEIHRNDSINTKGLRNIITQFGWPAKSLMGTAGLRAAFLNLQHSDLDSTIQEEFLPIITQAAKNSEYGWQFVAYLTD